MRRLNFAGVFGVVGLVSAALLLWAAPAFGLNYAVTPGSGDTVDIFNGDELCDDGTGTCSLRAAIQESNTTLASDTITIPAGTFQLTIDPGSPDDGTGDLDVFDDVTISGAGMGTTVIEQTDADRVIDFGISPDETVTLEDLTVTGGSLPQPAAPPGGGGILVRNGTATLQSVRVTGNEVTGTQNLTGGGLEVLGGGAAEVDVVDSVIDLNRLVATMAGAPSSLGAGIQAGFNSDPPSRLTVTRSIVSANEIVGPTAALGTSARGGGLRVDLPEATIEDSLIAGNKAGEGGGLSVGSTHSLTIERSTFSDNSATAATGRGGAVMSFALLGIEVVNSTFTGNDSADDAGAIMAFGFEASNSISDSTLAGNVAGGDGAGVAAGNESDITLTRTILANGPDDCGLQGVGSLTSGGENLEQVEDTTGDSCELMASPGGTDILDEDPLLGGLADNGGPTPTRAIGALSAARDAATGCPASAQDQRGQERPDGNAAGPGLCDAGAEFVDPEGDGVEVAIDNCPADANAGQEDADGDGIGDACDPTPFPPSPPGQAADTSLTLELSAKKKVKAGKAVKVKATCPAESCEVVARATFKVPKAALALVAGTKKLKTKRMTESLAGGVTETLKLKLKRGAKRKLKRAARTGQFGKKIKVIVKATGTDAAGNTDSGKLKLKLR